MDGRSFQLNPRLLTLELTEKVSLEALVLGGGVVTGRRREGRGVEAQTDIAAGTGAQFGPV